MRRDEETAHANVYQYVHTSGAPRGAPVQGPWLQGEKWSEVKSYGIGARYPGDGSIKVAYRLRAYPKRAVYS